jgi:hypothetical protein
MKLGRHGEVPESALLHTACDHDRSTGSPWAIVQLIKSQEPKGLLH